MRQEASIDSKLLDTIPKGTHLNYISTKGSWSKIRFREEIGYVLSSYVQKGLAYKVDNTIIVNKGYPLSSNFNPGVNPQALNAANRMKSDPKKDGVILNVFSDFRNFDYQNNLYNGYLRNDGIETADTYSARPGYSEHQTGLAFDIGGANPKYYVDQSLDKTKEGIWMATNSYKYGLILRYPKGKENITGFKYEPWHFRYVGRELAKEIKDKNLTLEEYFDVVHSDY